MKNRILDISKRHKLAHIGSCISVLPVLQDIYKQKQPKDIVILCNAHAHIAHLVVMEEYTKGDSTGLVKGIDAEEMLKYGIHCDRRAGCDATGGSLGHGIGIGIGYAFSDKKRQVYVVVSDGSMMEGSNFEALRIANDLELTNLHIYCNFNGYTAVAKVNTQRLTNLMTQFFPNINPYYTRNGEGFEGLEGHYKTI